MSYLKRDYTVQCWTPEHKYMALSIGVPLISFWVVGFPCIIMYNLWKNRKNLNDKEVVLDYGLFYVGLADHAFFWEILVSNFRKVIFIVCGTLLSPVNATIKVRNLLLQLLL